MLPTYGGITDFWKILATIFNNKISTFTCRIQTNICPNYITLSEDFSEKNWLSSSKGIYFRK